MLKDAFDPNRTPSAADKLKSPTPSVSNTANDGALNESMASLLNVLRTGSSQQRHDAAKAVGYIARTGLLPTRLKEEARTVIEDILVNEHPPISTAFALIESLNRVDENAFWSIVLSWYSQAVRVDASLKLPYRTLMDNNET